MTARRRGGQDLEGEDAFVRQLIQFFLWVRDNKQTVTVSAVILALAIGAGLYYRNYQQDLRQQAATQLQQLRSQLQPGIPPDTAAARLQRYVERYGGTRHADQGRLLLARVRLQADRWQEAIQVLQPVAERPMDSPVGYAARKLLAAAHEGAGDRKQALKVLGDLADEARFEFQRHAAMADRARLLARAGELRQAEALYARLVEETESGEPNAQQYRLRLGEVRARLRSRRAAAGARQPADTTSGEAPEAAESG